jgi:hypothetical protein
MGAAKKKSTAKKAPGSAKKPTRSAKKPTGSAKKPAAAQKIASTRSSSVRMAAPRAAVTYPKSLYRASGLDGPHSRYCDAQPCEEHKLLCNINEPHTRIHKCKRKCRWED